MTEDTGANRDRHRRGDIALLEAALEDQLQGQQPPDLTNRILNSTTDASSDGPAVTNRWLQAAAVVIAAVVATLSIHAATRDPQTVHGQASLGTPRSGQARESTLPKTQKQLVRWLRDAKSLTLRVETLRDGERSAPFSSGSLGTRSQGRGGLVTVSDPE